MPVNNRKDLLKNKGRVFIFDEAAAVKKWIEFTVVDSLKMEHPANPVEIKTPSGITIFQTLDLDAVLSGDWYHPGDLSKMELMVRGALGKTIYDGSTAQSEAVAVNFRKAGEAFPLPGFDGDKTVVTITNVKSEDGATTYVVTDDYTVAVDQTTGISHLIHTSDGDIPLNTDVIVTYSYTPLKSTILKPDFDTAPVMRHVMVDVFTDLNDLNKYRRYYLPNCVIESPLMHGMLENGKDNTSPNLMPFTFRYAKPDAASKAPKWYYIDTVNV